MSFGEAIQRDLARLGSSGFRGLPALPLPGRNGSSPSAEPTTPPELIQRLPSEVGMTAQTGLNLLASLPAQVAEDLTVTANNLLKLPREVAQELFQTPGQLARRLSPSNINLALATVRESADFRGVTDVRQGREKMRTLTDVINLFTPT